MRLLIIILICSLFAGCESDYEREIREQKEEINTVIHYDWEEVIPLDELVKVSKICQESPYLTKCDIVKSQIEDIAISLASCHADPRSRLCNKVNAVLGKHPILKILPKAVPLELPDSPWYSTLPTHALESMSSWYGYRSEVAGWWWERWCTFIYTISAFIAVLAIVIGVIWIRDFLRRKNKESLEAQEAFKNEQEKARLRGENESRIAAEREKSQFEKAKADQEIKVAQQMLEQREAAAKSRLEAKQAEDRLRLEIEQAELRRILNSAFNPPNRGKKNTPRFNEQQNL